MKTTLVQKVMCLAFCLEKLKRFNCPNAPPEREVQEGATL